MKKVEKGTCRGTKRQHRLTNEASSITSQICIIDIHSEHYASGSRQRFMLVAVRGLDVLLGCWCILIGPNGNAQTLAKLIGA